MDDGDVVGVVVDVVRRRRVRGSDAFVVVFMFVVVFPPGTSVPCGGNDDDGDGKDDVSPS